MPWATATKILKNRTALLVVQNVQRFAKPSKKKNKQHFYKIFKLRQTMKKA